MGGLWLLQHLLKLQGEHTINFTSIVLIVKGQCTWRLRFSARPFKLLTNLTRCEQIRPHRLVENDRLPDIGTGVKREIESFTMSIRK